MGPKGRCTHLFLPTPVPTRASASPPVPSQRPSQACELNGSLDESPNAWLGTGVEGVVQLAQGQPRPPHLGGQAVLDRLPSFGFVSGN